MIVARPLGIVRSALFFGSFLIARMPIWFVIVSSFINGFIKSEHAAAIIIGIIICRSFLESEIAGSGFFLFTALRICRFFAYIIGAVALDIAFFYLTVAAKPLDVALTAFALIIAVSLYFGSKNNKKVGYWLGYKVPFFVSVITTLLWLYLSFVPDTFGGNISILCAIYVIELINLFEGAPLPGLRKANGGG